MRSFGELEEQVMFQLWAADRPLQVRDVRRLLAPERTLAHTTVMTVLDKLYRKGWLRREAAGRAYAYAPLMSRDSYTAALMHDAWSLAAGPATALVYFIEAMNPEQQAALRDALRVVSLGRESADRDHPEGRLHDRPETGAEPEDLGQDEPRAG
ncbi:BlaI/MecI/CopY family transcriptional regulator [Actinopolymorpha singaporensis]|uniref:Predicted transcriptional regulator n=1 Tax=Actinopolymorpha singaporensis TaxID=117157 RepID=A0A1H1Y909_9ACTN|nr:BlaI/MecI/CopY family transcriptional regulator [Actinopolymorpha singaporensis]SDT17865.1 Predicted transcriptional regulator [Actinopolymorpha singaporensis]